METIKTRTHFDNGQITVNVPSHWQDKDVEVVLVVQDFETPKANSSAQLMAHIRSIHAQGGVVWPMDVVEWQKAERMDRPLPSLE